MFRTNFAVAAALCLALTTVSASVQAQSYESRGYGGPLGVGPNFHEGGQSAPPSYGPKSSGEERYTPKRERSVTKSREAPATREADTEKASPAATAASTEPAAESENSTIAGASVTTNSTEKTSPAAKASSIDKSGDSENSTITSAALQNDTTDANTDTKASPKAEAASAAPATCKRFIAAAGKTVTVPCD